MATDLMARGLAKKAIDSIKNVLHIGTNYNGLIIDDINGIQVIDIDLNLRTVINPEDSLYVEYSSDNGATWEKILYFNEDGSGYFQGLVNATSLEINSNSILAEDNNTIDAKYISNIKADRLLYSIIGIDWIGESAPYSQTILIEEITSHDAPIISPIYDDDNAIAINQKQAWSMINDIDTHDGSITVKCFTSKPTIEIPIQIKGA